MIIIIIIIIIIQLWNIKVTFIPIVICALGTVTEGLLIGLGNMKRRGRVKTIQNTTLLRSAGIVRRFLEIRRDLLSFKLQ